MWKFPLLQIAIFSAVFCDASPHFVRHRRANVSSNYRQQYRRASCQNRSFSFPSSTSTSGTGPTATSTPEPTSSPTSHVSSSESLLDWLFPAGQTKQSWTTCTESNNALPLQDSTFRPFDIIEDLSRPYVDAPDGTLSIKAHYPQGSFNPSHTPQGGISFYAPGTIDLTTAKEATFGYSVYFPRDFDYNLGGKLPGFYGGNTAEGAIGCSGGSRNNACFSARLMWRENGAGELYTYLPPDFSGNKELCKIPPFSECNPIYGASVGRGSFTFASGNWTTVAQRVKLNDPGQSNGELQLWVNGESVILVVGLVFRDSDEGSIRGIIFQTFFGGSNFTWASPEAQDAYFTNFSVAILQLLAL